MNSATEHRLVDPYGKPGEWMDSAALQTYLLMTDRPSHGWEVETRTISIVDRTLPVNQWLAQEARRRVAGIDPKQNRP
jgi:hypothetical protein